MVALILEDQYKEVLVRQTMNEQTVRVVVKLTLSPDADVQEVLSECDYYFEHEQIIDTEMIDADVQEVLSECDYHFEH